MAVSKQPKQPKQPKEPKTPTPRETPSGRRPNAQLDAYRRIRKPMPPPERVIPDKRREEAARIADREARDDAS